MYHKPYTLDQRCTAQQPVAKLSKSCKAALLGFHMMKKGLFWEYEEKVRNDPTFSEEAVMKAAEELNRGPINMKKVKAQNIKYVNITSQEGRSLGITGTPTWFISGRKMTGAYGYGELQTLIKYILQEKEEG
jgi:protein-disulfide isomerase